ncbi:MAG: hypothetical protein ACRBCK_02430 [Alphaproteobacteria bacterium]
MFQIGDKVIVSKDGGWKNDCSGVICSAPEPIDTLKGPENFYWVRFDQPEQDVNGDDEYIKAQVLSCYIYVYN